jgi:hypothetical protein
LFRKNERNASTTPLTIISMAVEYCIHSFWFDVISCEFESIGFLFYTANITHGRANAWDTKKPGATLTGCGGRKQ